MPDTSPFFIYGKQPINEKLRNEPEFISKIYIRQGVSQNQVKDIIDLAKLNDIPAQFVHPKKLVSLVGRVNDQGFVAQISPISYQDLSDWKQSIDLTENPIIVLLSEIEDAGNFGAILRSAAALGVKGVIIPMHRQAPINAGVIKASAGTAGIVPIIRVTNINQTVSELKDFGFWAFAMDMDADTEIWNLDMRKPSILILGNEGTGVKKSTLQICDDIVKIPMKNNVESLNVSVSGGILLYERIKQLAM